MSAYCVKTTRDKPGVWVINATITHIAWHQHRLAQINPYLDNASQAEIGHLADVAFAHQYIPGGQIPVDVVLRF